MVGWLFGEWVCRGMKRLGRDSGRWLGIDCDGDWTLEHKKRTIVDWMRALLFREMRAILYSWKLFTLLFHFFSA